MITITMIKDGLIISPPTLALSWYSQTSQMQQRSEGSISMENAFLFLSCPFDKTFFLETMRASFLNSSLNH